MLPLREVRDPSIPRRPPLVVVMLIVVNVFAFLYEQALIEAGVRSFPLEWGLVPRVLTSDDPAHGIVTVFTSMFLHGGWVHLLGNLWFLWIFGPSVEDVLGHARFAALYVLGGVAAAAAQVAIDPSSAVPMLGASGAIGGVLAAYVSVHPMRPIRTLIPIFIIPFIVSIPAFVFVIEWFLLNLLHGFGALAFPSAGGVAWWAHVGGFLSGLLLVRVLFPRGDDEHETSRRERGEAEAR